MKYLLTGGAEYSEKKLPPEESLEQIVSPR